MEHKKDTDLHKFLNFELSSDEEKTFKNSDEYQKYKQVLDVLENTKTVPFNETALLANIHANINANNTSEPKVIPLYKKWWPVSVVASILICCGLFITYTLKPISHNTAVAESFQFSLPDASSVWLNSKSEISYNKDWEKSRDITLSGEAYFEVAKGKKFTVQTAQGTVSVLGTKFNVKQRGSFFEVHCFEGSVAVNYNNTQRILKANDVYSSKAVKKQIPPLKKPHWLANTSVFNNTHLNDVLADISLHYDIEFKNLKNIENLTLKYTGSYQYTDDIKTVLEVLSKSLNLSYTLKNKSVYLNIKE